MIEQDLRLCTPGELLDSLAGKVCAAQVLHAEILEILAEADRVGVAQELGHKSLAEVLKYKLRWDISKSSRLIKQARLTNSDLTPTGSVIPPKLPHTADAVAAGELSEEQVDVIARAMGELPDEAEKALVTFARAHEPRAIRDFAKKLAYRFDQDGPEPNDTEPTLPANELRYEELPGGCIQGKFRLDALASQQFRAMHDPLAKPHPTGPDGPDLRGRAERDGDAFAEIIALAMRSDRLPIQAGEPVHIAVSVDYYHLLRGVGHALLDTGQRIAMADLRRIACTACVLPVVMGGESQILDIGRQSRKLTKHLRNLLHLRDKGCAMPGCNRPPKHCEAHHIKFWMDGGETKIDNLVLLCRRHHDLIHSSEWEVKMVDGVPLFYPPTFLDPLRKPLRNQMHTV